MSEANKAVVRRWVAEGLNQHNMALADELCADGYLYHQPSGADLDLEATKQMINGYLTAMPDLECTIEDMVAEGDKVASRWRGTGTHQGELMSIPPTGKRVTVRGIVVTRIVDGKFVEDWEIVDAFGLLQQLGAAPNPEADVAALRKLIDEEYTAAIKAGDAAAYASLYTEDALVMAPNQPAYSGREGARRFAEGFLAQFSFQELSFDSVEILVAGEWAYRRAHYALALLSKAGGEPIRDTGSTLEIYRRQPDGAWKIHRDIWNSELPASE